MSTTPVCDSQVYSVVRKDDGSIQAVIPLDVGQKLEEDLFAARAEVERLRSVLCCQGRKDELSAQVRDLLMKI